MRQGEQPSYQQLLSAIGRSLDRHAYQALILCELEDGFVARVARRDGTPEAIPFPRGDIYNLVRMDEAEEGEDPAGAVRDPAGSFLRRIHGSYRQVLEALGRQCDRKGVHSLLAMELPDALLVSYRSLLPQASPADPVTFEYLYDEEGVGTLLREGAAPRR